MRTGIRRPLGVLLAPLLLASCAVGAGSTSAPDSPGAAAMTVSPAPPSPSPRGVEGRRVNVSGLMDGGLVSTDQATGRLHFEFTYEMSDPRVTGTDEMDCAEQFFDVEELAGGGGAWWDCSMVLTGQGGTWNGVAAFGSEFKRGGDALRTLGLGIYEGQGALAGLRYVAMFANGPETAGTLFGYDYPVPFVIAGWIEPAE